MNYNCGNCGYEGPCYEPPDVNLLSGRLTIRQFEDVKVLWGVSKTWCPQCGSNRKLRPVMAELELG